MDIFLQWVGLAEKYQHSSTKWDSIGLIHKRHTSIKYEDLFVFLGSHARFFLFVCSFSLEGGLPKPKETKQRNRSAAVYKQPETRKTSWSATKRSQHERQVGSQPCKVFRVSVCVVYIPYVYVQHMQARHNFHVSLCVINYTSCTLEAIIEIIGLFFF